MSTRKTDSLDQARLERRRAPQPVSFAPRTAGLYSEVVWDRSWTTTSPVRGPDMAGADRQTAPTERPPA